VEEAVVPTWLVCTAGPLHGRRFQVRETGLSLGRADDNEIVISDEGVSRYHLRLIWQNGSLWAQDSGSRNGSFVNDTRVSGHIALKPGDVLTVSTHAFQVSVTEPPPSSAATTAPPARKRSEATPRRKRWYWPF
jgi:pSer/pThr/pTyr-binding forkhead associated (FHA) protein